MPSAEYDIRYLQAGMSLLEDYLLSADLYWPVGASPPPGEPPYPRLTLGGMLLARKRAQAYSLTTNQQAEFAQLVQQMDAVRSRWRSAWGQKAAREFRSRLNLWGNFLEDYRENPSANADRYRYEVGRRVQLQLLADEAIDLPQSDLDLLNGLDRVLQAALIPGRFIWDEELASGFPRETYWYLYGNLKSR